MMMMHGDGMERGMYGRREDIEMGQCNHLLVFKVSASFIELPQNHTQYGDNSIILPFFFSFFFFFYHYFLSFLPHFPPNKKINNNNNNKQF